MKSRIKLWQGLGRGRRYKGSEMGTSWEYSGDTKKVTWGRQEQWKAFEDFAKTADFNVRVLAAKPLRGFEQGCKML